MRSFPLLASVLLLAAGLTGCLGGGEEADPSETPAATGADDTVDAVENVTNDDGSAEMSQDLGHMPHIHDYWKDRERITIMDEDVQVDAPTALFWTFFDIRRGTPGVGGASLRLPEGQIVYEGTGQLEFTATWSDPAITGMGVAYRSAADPQFTQTQEIKSNTPFLIEVTPEMTDMPHAKSSRWQFLITPAQAGQVVAGKFHVKVDIVRMRDVTVFPGHPELFHGANTLTLFEGSGSSQQNNIAVNFLNAVQNKQNDDGVASEKVVPMETRSMTANLTIKAASSDLGKTSRVYLLAKPADRNQYGMVEAVAIDEATQLYQFAWLVEMQQTDSPYAKESDWKFDVFVTTEQGNGLEACGGCSAVKVDYDLTVVAYDDVVEGAKELRYQRFGPR